MRFFPDGIAFELRSATRTGGVRVYASIVEKG